MSGSEHYSELSTSYWLELMKAASVQGKVGIPGLMMSSSGLVTSHVNIAGLLIGESYKQYKQADRILKEALLVSLLPCSARTGGGGTEGGRSWCTVKMQQQNDMVSDCTSYCVSLHTCRLQCIGMSPASCVTGATCDVIACTFAVSQHNSMGCNS